MKKNHITVRTMFENAALLLGDQANLAQEVQNGLSQCFDRSQFCATATDIITVQKLDLLTQTLEDLATGLTACSVATISDHTTYSADIFISLKLEAVRNALGSNIPALKVRNDCEIF